MTVQLRVIAICEPDRERLVFTVDDLLHVRSPKWR